MLKSSHFARFAILFMALAATFAALPTAAGAQLSIGISVNFGPPAIPVYVQPPCPTQNDIWSPGYWAYGEGGYYWVPGTWVQPPDSGLLWTPGYWGWNGGSYGWNPGYWAPQVGYYGGVNYGYGYYGHDYVGGGWQGNRFRYNTAVTNVNRTVIQNTYINRTVVVNNWNRTSYNGGRGGVNARPTQRQLAVARGRRVFATPVQVQHQRVASQNRQNFSSINHGRPPTAAVVRPYSATNRPIGARPLTPAERKAVVIHHEAVHAASVKPAPEHPVAKHAVTEHVAKEHAAPAHVEAAHPVAKHAVTEHVVKEHAAPAHVEAAHPVAQHAVTEHVVTQHAAPKPEAPPAKAKPEEKHEPPH